MAKEVLAIPEERLGEVIRVLRAGMKAVRKSRAAMKPRPPFVRASTIAVLRQWCKDEEEYLRSSMFKEFWP